MHIAWMELEKKSTLNEYRDIVERKLSAWMALECFVRPISMMSRSYIFSPFDADELCLKKGEKTKN